MGGLLLRIAALTAVYLLVLTSLHPGDVAVGAVVATAAALATRQRARRDPSATRPPVPLGRRLAGVPALVGGTAVDVVVGTWEVARYCLAPARWPNAGLVSIPVDLSAPSAATAWAVRVGIAPDSIVVDVGPRAGGEAPGRGELVVHVRDASDPDAVRRAQLRSYERRQRRTFP